ncbi:alpha/beta hydrolase [Ferruginibacter sp.]|nr:alpha/beta hydrolase [Ferruginibacter sp.]
MKNKLTRLFLLLIIPVSLNYNAHGQNSEEWYIYTPDKLNLYINEFGKGDTVIVLHGGFGAEHSYMIDAVKPLQDKFHFVMFDQRGSLRSPAPDSLLSFEKMLADIETIRLALKLEKVTLVAHSMGTTIAMAYAEKYPMKVKNLVLLSSFLPISTNSELRNFATYYLENRAEVKLERLKVNFPQEKKDWPAKLYTYSWRISFASTDIYSVNKWRDIKGGVAFFNQHAANIVFPTAPVEWDYTTTLKQHKFPVTVINGDYDYLNFTAKKYEELLSFYALKKATTVNAILKEKGQTLSEFIKQIHWQDFEKELPTLNVYIIKNAGHRIWMDNAGTFKTILSKSISRKQL